ncbi:MAG: hypothetical protein MZV63_24285 [Marinilabiliales bacterium]|nr:hypothetical protein [Marinilabiliales bacterium]
MLNGYKLTLKGNLDLTGSGQIITSDINSTIEFAGTVSQSLPSGGLTDNMVYNIIVNNPSNVVVNGTLSILNSIVATSGRLDAISNTPTISYEGTSAQSIGANLFLNERIYNLSIDNTSGVDLNSGFTIDNDLTISSDCIFNIIAPSLSDRYRKYL